MKIQGLEKKVDYIVNRAATNAGVAAEQEILGSNPGLGISLYNVKVKLTP